MCPDEVKRCGCVKVVHEGVMIEAGRRRYRTHVVTDEAMPLVVTPGGERV